MNKKIIGFNGQGGYLSISDLVDWGLPPYDNLHMLRFGRISMRLEGGFPESVG